MGKQPMNAQANQKPQAKPANNIKSKPGSAPTTAKKDNFGKK